eukprot:12932231-Prorocentrum_lima.AAC.1
MWGTNRRDHFSLLDDPGAPEGHGMPDCLLGRSPAVSDFRRRDDVYDPYVAWCSICAMDPPMPM